MKGALAVDYDVSMPGADLKALVTAYAAIQEELKFRLLAARFGIMTPEAA